MFDQQVTEADRTSFFRILVNANPDHLPACAAFEDLLRGLVAKGGLRLSQNSSSRPNLMKYCVAANFLFLLKSMTASGKDIVGFWGAKEHWQNRTKIGAKIILGFRDALIASGDLKLYRQGYHDKGQMGGGLVALYEVSEALLDQVPFPFT